MKIERTFQGLEISGRVSGWARFFPAAFLSVWLAGWAVGEIAVITVLVRGAMGVLGMPQADAEPMALWAALGVGAFLMVWLAGWTLGGFFAAREWMRLLFGRERVVAGPDHLEFEQLYGLFRSRRTFRREELRRFEVSPKKTALVLETDEATRELLRFGKHEELALAAETLNAEYKLPRTERVQEKPPGKWVELLSNQGEPILVKDPAGRAKGAWVVSVISAAFTVLAVYLIRGSIDNLSLGAVAAMSTAAAVLIGWGAYRLHTTRDEYVLGAGRIELRKRTRGGVRAVFTATRLRLDEDRDSDGDVWYRLVLEPDSVSPFPGNATSRSKHVLESCINDPVGPRRLGRWLAGRTRVAFEGGQPPEQTAADIEALRRQLAATGRVGRWIEERLPRGPKG